jgi:hypothetical protein
MLRHRRVRHRPSFEGLEPRDVPSAILGYTPKPPHPPFGGPGGSGNPYVVGPVVAQGSHGRTTHGPFGGPGSISGNPYVV